MRDPDCPLRIWKDTSGRYIDRDTARALLKDGKTGVIDGFTARDGRTYRGVLEIVPEEWTLAVRPAGWNEGEASNAEPEFEVNPEPLGRCPFEEDCMVVESPTQFVCERKLKENELTREERAGLWFYESRGRCWKCHSGPNFTDEEFHNTGVGVVDGRAEDGRMKITGLATDRGRFKTPTLRGVALTAPYMHDGSLATLEEVVRFYQRGGVANPELSDEIQTFEMSDEDAAKVRETVRSGRLKYPQGLLRILSFRDDRESIPLFRREVRSRSAQAYATEPLALALARMKDAESKHVFVRMLRDLGSNRRALGALRDLEQEREAALHVGRARAVELVPLDARRGVVHRPHDVEVAREHEVRLAGPAHERDDERVPVPADGLRQRDPAEPFLDEVAQHALFPDGGGRPAQPEQGVGELLGHPGLTPPR